MEAAKIEQLPGTEPNRGQRLQMQRKFGMFLHFGVNTFGNVEWSDGGIPALSYQPTEIDAEQWVRTAYEAGMNFVVLTTKHHDGFCLWHTKETEYSVEHSGNKTDVVAEVARACRKYGLKLGLYYSLWDRSYPGYAKDFDGSYVPYMLRQLTELMDGRYGEIVELWLDGAWDKARSRWRLDLIYHTVKRLQPDCQIGVNHTVGVDDSSASFPGKRFEPKNYQMHDPLRMFPSDFRLWDPHVCRADDPKLYTFGGQTYYLPFEMTICSREGFSWFYSNIYESKPLLEVSKVATDCRTAFESDNIVVINMPPDTRGCLVEEDVAHLLEIADELGLRRRAS